MQLWQIVQDAKSEIPVLDIWLCLADTEVPHTGVSE